MRAAGPGRRQAVRHRHPAAQCHGRAAHGACAQQHAAGRALPLRAHARPRRALATGHRSRRHRHADGRRAPAHGAPGAGPADARARGVRAPRVGLEGGERRRDREPAEAARRLVRLESRALHDGSRGSRSAPSSRRSSSSTAPGSSPRTSASSTGTRSSRPRSPIWRWCRSRSGLVLMGRRQSGEAVRCSGARQGPRQGPKRAPVLFPLSPDGAGQGLRQGLHRRRNDAARDDAGRHWRRRASHGSALRRANQGQGDGDAAARRPRDPDRRRRVFRSNEGHGRGQDHARARLQRLRGRPAALSAADQRTRRVGQDRFAAR